MSFTIIATDSGNDDPETRAQRQWGMCVRPLSRGQMWRARLLAVTGMLWIVSVTGFVIHEVDSLCDSHDR